MYRLVLKLFIFLGLGIATAPLISASSPESADGLRLQGLSYRQQENYPAAIAAFRQAVNLEPGDLSGRVLLGWTLHLSGDQNAAEQALLSAVYLNPSHVPALNALGIVYLVEGDLLSTVAVHTWAAELAPNNEIPHYNLSLAFHRLRWYDRAIASAKRAASLEPANPHPWIALAIAHWDQGEHTAAQHTLQDALVLNGSLSDPSFLKEDLTAAAFSPDQIRVVQQILTTAR
jgi:Flp pilus assembly protein TadD